MPPTPNKGERTEGTGPSGRVMEGAIRVADGGVWTKMEGGPRTLGSPTPIVRGSRNGSDSVHILGKHFKGTHRHTAHQVHLPNCCDGTITLTKRGTFQRAVINGARLTDDGG